MCPASGTCWRLFSPTGAPSFPVQYAVVVAISGLASAFVMRAIGNEIAARFDAINTALSKAMSGTLH